MPESRIACTTGFSMALRSPVSSAAARGPADSPPPREDARRNRVADRREEGEQPAALARGRGDRRRRAQGEADGAQTLEPRLPREIPGAGLRRDRRRAQAGECAQPRSGEHGIARAARADPHPLRRFLRRQPFDLDAVEKVAPRALAGADPEHPPGDPGRVERRGEHRRAHPLGPPVGGADSRREKGQGRQPQGRRQALPQQHRAEREDRGGQGRDPGDGLHRQRQVEPAAGAEEHRRPEEQPVALGGQQGVEALPQAGRAGSERGPFPLRRARHPLSRAPAPAAALRAPPADVIKARPMPSRGNPNAFREG